MSWGHQYLGDYDENGKKVGVGYYARKKEEEIRKLKKMMGEPVEPDPLLVELTPQDQLKEMLCYGVIFLGLAIVVTIFVLCYPFEQAVKFYDFGKRKYRGK